MKDELKCLVYTKKYVFIFLALLTVVALIGWYMIMSDTDGSPYCDFISDIERYENKDELQQLYDDAAAMEAPTTPESKFDKRQDMKHFLQSIYGFSLENNLPYDSLVLFKDVYKYSHFQYMFAFSNVMGIFIFVACSLIGSFYYTGEVNGKIGKLIYTSGAKREKLIASKYLVSMLFIMAVTLILDVIMGLFALIYKDTGVKYCVILTTDYNFLHFNYVQFFVLMLLSHLIAILCTYTFTYFISVIIKNGVICFAGMLLTMVAFLVGFEISNDFTAFWNMATGAGFINAFKVDGFYVSNIKILYSYIPIVLIPLITALSAIPFIKRADYSR